MMIIITSPHPPSHNSKLSKVSRVVMAELKVEDIRRAVKKLKESAVIGDLYCRIHESNREVAERLAKTGVVKLVNLSSRFTEISPGTFVRKPKGGLIDER